MGIAPPNILFGKQNTTSFTKMGSPKVSVVLPGRSRQNFVPRWPKVTLVVKKKKGSLLPAR